MDSRPAVIANKLGPIIEVDEWSTETLYDESAVVAADDFLAGSVVVADLVAFIVVGFEAHC